MSGNQFDFYSKQKKTTLSPKQTLSHKNNKDKKPKKVGLERILDDYDKLQVLRSENSKFREMLFEEENLTNQILRRIQILKTLEPNDVKIKILNDELNLLDLQHANLKNERDLWLKKEFEWLYTDYPEIFEMITGPQPPLRTTLESVLKAYIRCETGESDRRSVVKESLESMRKQQGLPEDFFDYSKLDQYV